MTNIRNTGINVGSYSKITDFDTSISNSDLMLIKNQNEIIPDKDNVSILKGTDFHYLKTDLSNPDVSQQLLAKIKKCVLNDQIEIKNIFTLDSFYQETGIKI